MAKRIFSKRTLAILLTLVMVFNMTGIGAFAAEADTPDLVENFRDTYYKQDGSAGSANDWQIHLSKTAAPTAQDNVYSITLKVQTKDTFTQIAGTTDGAAVLVLDVSNSMNKAESGCAHEGCAAKKNAAVHCMNYRREYFWKDQCEHCGQTRAQHEAHHTYAQRTQLDSLKLAVADFLDAFANGANAGEKRLVSVVVFGTKAKTIQTWVDISDATARQNLKNTINSLSTGDGAYLGRSYLFNGGTNMEGGLVLGRNLLKQSAVAAIPAANQSLILFSDGAPTACVSNASSTAVDEIGYGGRDEGTSTDSVDYDDIASILSGVSAAKIAVAYNYNDDLNILKVPPFTRVISSGADSLSVDLQGEAGKVITNKTNASTVTDPMGTGVSMVTVTTNYNAVTKNWDLSKLTPTVADGITTYTVTYLVEIDPEAVAADPNYPGYTVLTPANGETTLNYTYGEAATPVNADFNEPNIRGIRSFTVRYEYVGEVPAGAPEVPADQTYKAGQSVTVAAAPTLENYTFSGWSKTDFEMPAEDVVIIGSWTENAKYDYTLIYNANFGDNETKADAENVTGTYAAYHSLAVDGNHFSRPNYTFIGWNTEADGSGTAYVPAQTLTLTAEDNTEILYAQWREHPKYDYTVIYDANFGTNETKADPENISGIYATTHSVRVDPNGFVRPNYTFTGWNTQRDGSGTAYTPEQVINLTAEDNTEILYAQWQENPKYDYSVIYNANFGDNETKLDAENVTGTYVNPYSIEVDPNGFVRPNYTFIGWSETPEGEVVYRAGNEIAFAASGSVTLYAQWEEDPKFDYTVIYDANFGGNETLADEENIIGTYDTEHSIGVNENTFERPHFTFLGWSDSRDGEVIYQAGDSIHFVEGGQQTLYAQWLEHPKYNYTVIYNGNGGTLAEGQLAYGDSENILETYAENYNIAVDANTFLRPNYTFTGWNTAADGTGTAYTAEEVIALTAEANTATLYAQWQENPKYDYTVIYDANFGTDPAVKLDAENITGTYATEYSIAVDANSFLREGYTFTGWNTAADGTGTAYTAEQAIALTAEANTAVLYAQWQIDRHEYTVNYFVRVNGEAYTLFAGTLPAGAPIGGTADYGTVIDRAYLEALGLPASLTDGEYTYEINAFEGITVTAEGNAVNVYYTCIVSEPPVEIPEEDVPQGDIELPEEELPQEEIVIPEEDVPMNDLPKTGDPVMIFAAMAGLSGTGLVFLTRKKKETEGEEA